MPLGKKLNRSCLPFFTLASYWWNRCCVSDSFCYLVEWLFGQIGLLRPDSMLISRCLRPPRPLSHIFSLPKGLGNKTGHCRPINYIKQNQLVLLLSPIPFRYKGRNRILTEQETFVSVINTILIFSMRSYERQFKKKALKISFMIMRLG